VPFPWTGGAPYAAASLSPEPPPGHQISTCQTSHASDPVPGLDLLVGRPRQRRLLCRFRDKRGHHRGQHHHQARPDATATRDRLPGGPWRYSL